LNFIAHMLLYPEIQTKIQKEIDDKIGRGGSITSAEIKSLKYFMAAWKESLRFNPAVPMGETSLISGVCSEIDKIYRCNTCQHN
jgi:cytochrome P450